MRRSEREVPETWKRDSAKRKRGVVLTPGIADAVRKGTTEKIEVDGRRQTRVCHKGRQTDAGRGNPET